MNTKYTARIRNITATKWFHCNDSPLNRKETNTPNTTHDITSCITFNCTNENGPPFMSEPIRFAGIRNAYSSSATHQLISTINTIEVFGEMTFISWSFRLPYQARVMKLFDTINSKIVSNDFDIVVYFYCFLIILGGSRSGCILLIDPQRL